jgi:ketosteroid isomerase-like protein
VVFEPEPVDARATYERRARSADRLEWEPSLAGVAAAGDLAFTSGPWRLRPAGTIGERDAHGHYVSVWRPDRSGAWKVIADIGVTHAAGPRWSGAVTYMPLEVSAARAPLEPGRARADLLQLDRSFGERATRAGLLEAYRGYLAGAALLYRPGHEPLDAGSAAPLLDEPAAAWHWDARDGAVSRSGDLAFTYGRALRESVAEAAGGDPFSYLRVWRHETSGWRLLLDVVIPAAPPAR